MTETEQFLATISPRITAAEDRTAQRRLRAAHRDVGRALNR